MAANAVAGRKGKSVVKVGLALGGGFARGIAHVGVLQALTANQIPIAVVAGTSAGSLVGAMYAAGTDPWLMERLVAAMNWRALVRLRLRRDGLLDAEGLERFIVDQVGDLGFADLRLPFAATATDLLTGQGVLLDQGRLATAVRASCAFPGIFLPVRIGSHTLVDGGLTNPVPASATRSMGADLVIGVEVGRAGQEQGRPRNLLHIMWQSLSLVQRPLIERAVQEADLVIRPDLSAFSAIELERVQEMVQLGREATEAVIPAIRQAIAACELERRESP